MTKLTRKTLKMKNVAVPISCKYDKVNNRVPIYKNMQSCTNITFTVGECCIKKVRKGSLHFYFCLFLFSHLAPPIKLYEIVYVVVIFM